MSSSVEAMAVPGGLGAQPQLSEACSLTPDDVVKLAAVDSNFYSRAFFPRAVRMPSPSMHRAVWNALEVPGRRLINIQMMRDGAKTTLLRLFTAKRVAYGMSRTILYLGKSDAHATRSLGWIRNQVMNNTAWAMTYGLRKGETFNDTESVIINTLLDARIWIVAMGINGSVRGVNLDDYRPDLIILDDVIDDENAGTPAGRVKTSERIHGAVKESLAPESECEDAKLVLLNTPVGAEDASMQALKDQEFFSLRFPCWTLETEFLPVEQRVSSWPERYPSDGLRRAKAMAALRGQSHIFSREKECRIVSPESAPLQATWLRFYEEYPPRHTMQVCMAIDPVPKPTPQAIAKGLHKRDFEALAVWGRVHHDYFLLEYLMNRGHDPGWTLSSFWYLALKWQPRMIRIESVAYQVTLSWIITQSMKEKGIYYVIDEFIDKREKIMRITDTFAPLGSHNHIHVRQEHLDFIQQWNELDTSPHLDVIDASASAVIHLAGQQINQDLEAEYSVHYEKIPDSAYGCP